MVEEMLAARGILVSHETVRQWALKFSQTFAHQIRRRLPVVSRTQFLLGYTGDLALTGCCRINDLALLH
jgi:hypothetical protein